MKITILYSGGLDSRIMLQYAKSKHPTADISCVYYAHGADSEETEISLLPDFVDVRTVDWLNDKIRPQPKKSDPLAGSIYIPARNLVFCTLAAAQDLPDEIWMGTLFDEDNLQATDKNTTFRALATGTLSYVLSPFKDNTKVVFPFVDEKWTKYEAIQWALENGLTPDMLKDTVSCWHFNVKEKMACGECKQCFKRAMLFRRFEIREPHVVDPLYGRAGQSFIQGYKEIPPESRNADEIAVNKLIDKLGL